MLGNLKSETIFLWNFDHGNGVFMNLSIQLLIRVLWVHVSGVIVITCTVSQVYAFGSISYAWVKISVVITISLLQTVFWRWIKAMIFLTMVGQISNHHLAVGTGKVWQTSFSHTGKLNIIVKVCYAKFKRVKNLFFKLSFWVFIVHVSRTIIAKIIGDAGVELE